MSLTWVNTAAAPPLDISFMTLGTDGLIYAVAYNGYISAYDPAANSWASKTRIVATISGIVADGNGNILAPSVSAADMYIYDTSSDSWTTETLTGFPSDIYIYSGGSSVAYGNGGTVYAVASPSGADQVMTLYMLNVSTKTWSTKAALPNTGEGVGITVAGDGNLYAITDHGNAYVYSYTANSWTSIAGTSFGRVPGIAVGADGNIYATGGYVTSEYNLTSDSWSTVAHDATNTLFYPVAMATASDGTMYAPPSSDLWALVAVPDADTLTAPTNASYADATGDITFTATNNNSPTWAADANARAMRIRPSGGSYSYYNASTNALQSTAVWNPVSIAPGASGSFTLPAAALSNGTSYNWSMADQVPTLSQQGPFASDFTLNAQAPPTVTVNDPTGTITSAYPIVSWTPTAASGASITAWQCKVFSAAQYGAPGFDPDSSTATWDSGVTSNTNQSVTVGTALTVGTTYRFYVQVTETGGETSTWTYSSATVQYATPATPAITAVQSTGPNGLPVVALTVDCHDNLLTTDDASFESSVGTWTAATNWAVSQDTGTGLDGSDSLKCVRQNTTAGHGSAATGAYSVTPGHGYTAMVSIYADSSSTGLGYTVAVKDSDGNTIESKTVTLGDADTWTGATLAFTPAAGVTEVALYVGDDPQTAPADSQTIYLDEAGIFPGTVTDWTRGGLVGSVQIVVTRDDGLQVRGASTANPASMPTSQTLTLSDAEVVPTVGHTWTAVAHVVLDSTTTITSATSDPTATVALTTTGWWEFDPTDLSTAVNAQMVDYNPQIMEQSAAHIVLGQKTPNIIADAMGGVDGTATFETFTVDTYQGLSTLLTSQKTVFVSDPFGDNAGVTYVRFGPQAGGMSTGSGNTTKNANLHPSTASAPHHRLQVTWVAQPRPAV